MYVNKVTIVGKLSREITTKIVSGYQITEFTLTTQRQYGKSKGFLDYHRIIIFADNIEIPAISIGSFVGIEGCIQYSNYEKNGVKMYSTSILASSIQVIQNNMKESLEGSPASPTTYSKSFNKTYTKKWNPPPILDDDIPF